MKEKTVLKKVNHERFIIDLIYASENNSFYKNMYAEFGLSDCLVHPKLYDALMDLVPILEEKKLKLIIYDTLRPWAVQKFMYETAPDYIRPYLAPPPEPDSRQGFHPRGCAIDCYLADEDGNALAFPTTADAFYPGYENDPDYMKYLDKVDRAYDGDDITKEQKENRAILEKMMVDVGLEPLPSEWWHFNLPMAWNYPIIYSLDDVIIE